jgi:hypothetical protein
MNIAQTLQHLYGERAKLGHAIAALEELRISDCSVGEIDPAHRRGRKSMGEAERREVSERMKRYWANKKSKS